MCFLLIISILANAGGIGGGGLVVPILLICFNFYTHEAIPLSKIMIFSGAISAFIMNRNLKHPFRNAISIDYNIIMILCSPILLGTMMGVTINRIIPPIVILSALTVILFVNTYKTFKRGIEMYKNEKLTENELRINEKNTDKNSDIELNSDVNNLNSINRQKNNDETFIDSGYINIRTSNESDLQNNNFKKEINISESDKIRLCEIEENYDKNLFNLKKYAFFIFNYLVMLIISLIKGSNYFTSIFNIENCSFLYWFIFSMYIPIVILLTFMAIKSVIKTHKYREFIGFKFNKWDINWNYQIAIKFATYGFLSGCLSAMLGIGGGLIISPVLLEVGLHPLVASSTSNFLVLFTSSSTSLQFMLFGMVKEDYGIVFFLLSILGSIIGSYSVQKLIKNTGKYSYLIFILGITLLISSILIPGESLFSLINAFNNGKSIFKINSPC